MKLIEEAFQSMIVAAYPTSPGPLQLTALRAAFFGGAATITNTLMKCEDDDAVAEALVESIVSELEAYGAGCEDELLEVGHVHGA